MTALTAGLTNYLTNNLTELDKNLTFQTFTTVITDITEITTAVILRRVRILLFIRFLRASMTLYDILVIVYQV